ncbi:Uncharacterised protein [Mycobacterium tuberculosis]|nr:Uncharacterised protein [Mycobacterium tuberculosis]
MNGQKPTGREAIEQVLHTYCRAVDERDTELLAQAVYAPHAIDRRRADKQYEGIDGSSNLGGDPLSPGSSGGCAA